MAWGMVAGAAISALGSYLASKNQQHGSSSAADTAQNIFDQTFAAGQPYRDAGAAATARLRDLLGISDNTGAQGFGSLTSNFTPADFLANKDPGYAFQLKTGAQALQNSQAANSGVLSGAALKDLIGFNQGMAATGYQNAFDRWMNQNNAVYSRLGNLATLGQNSAANAGSSGANFANIIGNAQMSGANAGAAGIIGASNSINSGLGYYQLGQLLNQHQQTAGGSTFDPISSFLSGTSTSGD